MARVSRACSSSPFLTSACLEKIASKATSLSTRRPDLTSTSSHSRFAVGRGRAGLLVAFGDGERPEQTSPAMKRQRGHERRPLTRARNHYLTRLCGLGTRRVPSVSSPSLAIRIDEQRVRPVHGRPAASVGLPFTQGHTEPCRCGTGALGEELLGAQCSLFHGSRRAIG